MKKKLLLSFICSVMCGNALAAERNNACGEYVYVAASKKNTQLYRFNPLNGEVKVVDNVKSYPDGYTALGLRPADKKIYGMSFDNLITIDPITGVIEKQKVQGLASNSAWFNGDFEPDGKTLFVSTIAPNKPTWRIDVRQKPLKAEPFTATGGGRWDDWVFHPADKRLYSVDGDNGDLLVMDFNSKTELKTVLKQSVFPPAQASDQPSANRKAYSALFFDEKGVLYAIDSRGNVSSTDLRESTESSPVDASQIHSSEIVGGVPIDVNHLEVINAAGCIKELPVPPSYDNVSVSQHFNTSWPVTWPLKGRMYSYDLDVNSGKDQLRKFRVSFKLAQQGEVASSGVTLEKQTDDTIFLESKDDQVLPAEQNRKINIQVLVPGDNLPAAGELTGLFASALER